MAVLPLAFKGFKTIPELLDEVHRVERLIMDLCETRVRLEKKRKQLLERAQRLHEIKNTCKSAQHTCKQKSRELRLACSNCEDLQGQHDRS